MIRGEFHETIAQNPPAGWERGHVSLQLYMPEERKPVEAWRKGAFAIHGVAGRLPARLTHAPTGLRISDFISLDDAVECAERIEPFTDWIAITKKFDTGSSLFPKVRDVVEDIHDRLTDPVGHTLAQGERS